MIFEKQHTPQKFRAILAVVFTFCILISSCAIKNSIRQLLNFGCAPVSQSSPTKEKKYQNPAPSVCKICKDKEILTKEQNSKDFSFSDLPELTAFAFIIFCGAFLWSKFQKHPFYSSSKLENDLPIFLRYRKLII